MNKLLDYTDSDYVGDIDDKMSTSGYALMFGNGAIAWTSKKQPIVTLSTTEAKFIVATLCACQSKWLRSKKNHGQIGTHSRGEDSDHV